MSHRAADAPAAQNGISRVNISHSFRFVQQNYSLLASLNSTDDHVQSVNLHMAKKENVG